MKLRCVYLVACLAILPFTLQARQGPLDSLRALVGTAQADTQKVKWLNELTWKYLGTGEFEAAIAYAKEASELAAKLKYKQGLALAFNNMGVAHKNLGNYPAALQWYYRTLAIWEELGDKPGIASANNNLGVTFKNQGEYAKALERYQISLKIREELGDEKNIAASLNNIGLIYSAQRKFDEALKNYERARELAERSHNERIRYIVLNNLGTIYESKLDYARALDLYEQAMAIEEKDGNKFGMATSYINISNVLLKSDGVKNSAKAEVLLRKSLQLSKETGSKDNIKDCYSMLSALHENRGDHRLALEEYKLYVQYRDSLFNEENTKKSVQLEMNFEFEKKEAAAKLEQEKKDAIAAADRRRQRIILLAVSGFGLLILGFAIFAWRSFLQKKKANQEISRQKQIIEEKQKEILDSIHYAKRIQQSLLPNSKYIGRTLSRLYPN